MRVPVCIAAVCVVSACSIAEDIAQTTVRNETKGIVNAQVAESFPGLNAAPITDCIIDNASTSEILTIGQAAITGVTPATTQLILTIAQRPDTLSCIAENGTGLFTL